MIPLPNGWLQWDYQIATFRGEIDGRIFGGFGGEFTTPQDLAAAAGVSVSPEGLAELTADREADIDSQSQQFNAEFDALLLRKPASVDAAALVQKVDAVAAEEVKP